MSSEHVDSFLLGFSKWPFKSDGESCQHLTLVLSREKKINVQFSRNRSQASYGAEHLYSQKLERLRQEDCSEFKAT